MGRVFNTAGICIPRKHYMLPPEERLPGVRQLIDDEFYFVLHAPRQTGKSTCVRTLAEALTSEGRYAALHASCERGQTAGSDLEAGVDAVIQAIEDAALRRLPEELRPTGAWDPAVRPESRLLRFLMRWCQRCPRPVALFLDEIDALRDETLLSVLRQLRDGYTDRPAAFPQSLALIGLRDVRDYKVRMRDERDSMGTASPFNIKVRSLSLGDFSEPETRRLLAQHTSETGQVFDEGAQDRVVHLSQGQPWLVNALAQRATWEGQPDRSLPITASHIDEAAEQLILARETHLDSLVDKLRDPRVRRVIEPILIGDVAFDPTFDDDYSYVSDLGLVTRRAGSIVIANPIYQEIIPRILSSHVQAGIALDPTWYVAADGTLDMLRLIDGFLTFWRRHGEVLLKGMPYHEAAPHLVFMAYLQRILNGGGRVEREFAVGTGRADLVTDFGGRQDLIELKLQRGSYTLPEGLDQVARYAKRLGRDRGYLLIFDPGADTPWEERGEVEEVAHEGVTVVVVRG